MDDGYSERDKRTRARRRSGCQGILVSDGLLSRWRVREDGRGGKELEWTETWMVDCSNLALRLVVMRARETTDAG